MNVAIPLQCENASDVVRFEKGLRPVCRITLPIMDFMFLDCVLSETFLDLVLIFIILVRNLGTVI